MSRERQFVKNTIVLSLGSFLPRLVSVITLPIITGKLTKAELGTYDLISTLVMLLLPIATLQIQSAAFRFLIERRGDKVESSKIITNIFIVTLPISLIVSAVAPFFLSGISNSIRATISLYFFADILFLTTSQIARGLSFNKLYSICSIAKSCIDCLGLIATLLVMNMGLFGVLLSLVVAYLFSFVILFIKTRLWRYIRIKKISKSYIKEMLRYSFPMIPNNLSNWVLKLSDRLVITAVLGVEANAVYAVANKIPNLLSIAQSVMVMAWQENASIVVKDKDASKYYSRMFDVMYSLICGCTAILVAFTPIIFKLLIKGDYEDAYIQMPMLVLAMFFYCMSSFQGGIYIAHKKTKSVGISTTIAAAINLIVNLTLVHFIGITAASLSTLVAYFVLFVYRMYDVRKFQTIYYNYKKIFGLLLVLIIILGFCSLQIFWFDILNIIIGGIVCVLCNWDLLKTLIKTLKRKLVKSAK